MGFASLPDRIHNLPEIYKAIPVAPPPVYNTSAMIEPLMKLADHFSPTARALRQAAVAKANYEYRLYSQGGMDKLWWMKNRMQQLQMRQIESNIRAKNAATGVLRFKSGSSDPVLMQERAAAGVNIAPTAQQKQLATTTASDASVDASTTDDDE